MMIDEKINKVIFIISLILGSSVFPEFFFFYYYKFSLETSSKKYFEDVIVTFWFDSF